MVCFLVIHIYVLFLKDTIVSNTINPQPVGPPLMKPTIFGNLPSLANLITSNDFPSLSPLLSLSLLTFCFYYPSFKKGKYCHHIIVLSITPCYPFLKCLMNHAFFAAQYGDHFSFEKTYK